MILPKKDKDGRYYLSYSQISSFIYNPKDYINSYFLNKPIQFTAYIDFGSKVGKALELDTYTGFEENEVNTLSSVKRFDLFEEEISVDFDNFYVKGFIDTLKKDYSALRDYKTGTEKKISEYQKLEYIQPILYALGIYQKTGILTEDLGVILIERLGNPMKGEQLKVGNKIWEIDVPINKKRIAEAKDLVYQTAKQISDYYKVFLKLNK